MTALALALVACCAMVCGTRLVLRAYDVREIEAQTAMRDTSALASKVESYIAWSEGWVKAAEERESNLRSEVDSLRAQMALRSSM